MNSDTLRAKVDVPNGVPPQCQLYATNTDFHTPFAVCPVTKRNSDLTHDLTSRGLHSRDAPHSHILAIRDTACEAPTDFQQGLVCGKYNGGFALGFFILFFIICFAWILSVRKQKIHRLDEERGAAIWPGRTHVPLTRTSNTNFRREFLKAHQDWRCGGVNRGTEQYQPVAWRYSSRRAARAYIKRKVQHGAGRVAGLPGIEATSREAAAHHHGMRGEDVWLFEPTNSFIEVDNDPSRQREAEVEASFDRLRK